MHIEWQVTYCTHSYIEVSVLCITLSPVKLYCAEYSSYLVSPGLEFWLLKCHFVDFVEDVPSNKHYKVSKMAMSCSATQPNVSLLTSPSDVSACLLIILILINLQPFRMSQFNMLFII